MNNSHMIAMLERKLSHEDRKIWCRAQDDEEVTLPKFLEWMNKEMKARMRSTAPIRSEIKINVNYTSELKDRPYYTCWVCKVSEGHWTDQCEILKSKSPRERMQLAVENRACFSCLKRGSKEHNMTTCRRRRLCTEMYNGQPCKSFHNFYYIQTLKRKMPVLAVLKIVLLYYQC